MHKCAGSFSLEPVVARARYCLRVARVAHAPLLALCTPMDVLAAEALVQKGGFTFTRATDTKPNTLQNMFNNQSTSKFRVAFSASGAWASEEAPKKPPGALPRSLPGPPEDLLLLLQTTAGHEAPC